MPISSPKPKSRQTNHTLEPNNNPLPPRLKHKHINHVNIALDPITHLNNIDHIVDDISHEIVHRHRHSPNKNLETEANNVELMKEFARYSEMSYSWNLCSVKLIDPSYVCPCCLMYYNSKCEDVPSTWTNLQKIYASFIITKNSIPPMRTQIGRRRLASSRSGPEGG